MSGALRSIARRLLERRSGSSAPEGVLEDAAAVLERLCSQLEALVGPEGCRVLLARAVERARADHPLLRAVRVKPGVDLQLREIGRRAAGRDASDLRAALEAVVAEFIGLTARLLGAETVMRVLRKDRADLPDPFPLEERRDDAVEGDAPRAADGGARPG